MKSAFVSVTALLKRIDFLLRTGNLSLAEELWKKLAERNQHICQYLSLVDTPFVKVFYLLKNADELQRSGKIDCNGILVDVAELVGAVVGCVNELKDRGAFHGPYRNFLERLNQCVALRINKVDMLFEPASESASKNSLVRAFFDVVGNNVDVFIGILKQMVDVLLSDVCNPEWYSNLCMIIVNFQSDSLEQPSTEAVKLKMPLLSYKGGDKGMEDALYRYASLPFFAEAKRRLYSIAVISDNGEIVLGSYNGPEGLAYLLHNAGVSLPFYVKSVGSVNSATEADVAYIKKYEETDDLPEEWEWFDGMYLDLEDADGRAFRLVYFVE